MVPERRTSCYCTVVTATENHITALRKLVAESFVWYHNR